MSLVLTQHAHAAGRSPSPRASRAGSASTGAASPSTRARTSATRAPSSPSTCSAAICARAGSTSRFVRNFTDVDDKIIQRAARGRASRRRRSPSARSRLRARTSRGSSACRPAHEPRATEHIDDMVAMIERLVAEGLRVSGLRRQRVLPRAPLRRLRQALAPAARRHEPPARASIRTRKTSTTSRSGRARSPASRPGRARGAPGGPAGTSSARPWRSATWATGSTSTAAARDLIFPHHENEIAQSEADTGTALRGALDAQRHAHVGHREDVEVARQHPLGSRGGAARRRPRRCACSTSARTIARRSTSPARRLEEARGALTRLYETLARADEAAGGWRAPIAPDGALAGSLTPFETAFCEAMDDDLNAAKAMGLVFDRIRDLNRALDAGDRTEAAAVRAELARVGVGLGLMTAEPAALLHELRARGVARAGIDEGAIEAAITARNDARARRDFARGRRHPGPAPRAGDRARGRSGRHDLEGSGVAGGQPETRLGPRTREADALGTRTSRTSAHSGAALPIALLGMGAMGGHEPGAPVRDFRATFTDVDGVQRVGRSRELRRRHDARRRPRPGTPARAVREHRSHRRRSVTEPTATPCAPRWSSARDRRSRSPCAARRPSTGRSRAGRTRFVPAICERSSSPRSRLRPGRSARALVVLLLASGPLACRPGPSLDVKLWPVLRYARNDARGELRWSALGPLIEYVRTPDLRDLRIRPLLWLTRRLGDTPVDRMEILTPILSAEPPARLPEPALPPRVTYLDGSPRCIGVRHVVVHVLPVRLLASRPRARHDGRRLPVLPRPGGRLRLRASAYGAVPRLPRARRAAGRATLLRLPLRLHRRRSGRPRLARLAVLRRHRGRGPRARALRALAVLHRERPARAGVRLGAAPARAARPTRRSTASSGPAGATASSPTPTPSTSGWAPRPSARPGR